MVETEIAQPMRTTRRKKVPKQPHRMHPNSLANLKPPQKPGDPSLNPGGKTGPLIGPAIRRMAARKVGAKFEPQTNADLIAQAALAAAGKLKVDAMKLIADRVDGVQTQKSEITGADGAPLQVEIQIKQAADELRRILDKRIDAAEAACAEGDAIG
jgi:hypothetical protein